MSNLKFTGIYFFIGMVFCFSASYGQNLNENWQKDLTISLEEFLNCVNTTQDSDECGTFIGASLHKVYKLDVFYSEKLRRYLSPHEMVKSLDKREQWTLLGRAYEQKALKDAQDKANTNTAVIAVYTTVEGVGHIALILPGDLQYSGSWGIDVPNSASFFMNNPEKSYVGKGLSYAFAKNMIKDVVLYSRNY